MPALADVLGPHAQTHARPALVAGRGGGEEFLAGEVALELRDGDERGQHHRADVQDAGAMHVVELEALHLGAVRERGVRR
jgi:hypothetical protein